MDLKNYHLGICNDIELIINQSHTQLELGKYHVFSSDLLQWSNILKNQRTEMKVLENVAYELQFSVFLVSSGLYRQAFASLRLVLELALSGILFSSDEFYFRKWKQGLADVSWAKITDENTGIFSTTWLQAFYNPEIDQRDKEDNKEISKLAKETYRKLSEYVHGGNYTWETDNSHIVFNQIQFDLWKKLSDNTSRIILYSLLIRFAQDLSSDNLTEVEDCLTQIVDDLKITRDILGRPL
ncbi:hypothetical protein [Nodularia spumigena]|uniref:Uncharacterized protein n=1 Tax=Nodularia spumigena UHCC 0060 TaxID=3110300 RepID=A0ABU5UNQ0_NODSP|nr:hypothetical protein [Nodularia spumigena]MEA5525148.1 hypothetical protein [Nodularia spumigena UHCC 0143]MEA5607910.1 hypothetical protein [Nodularia spumigena UHCC 0060]MEA5612794.1 hypothetical protein [Nodularia spumigena UHCC 0040]